MERSSRLKPATWLMFVVGFSAGLLAAPAERASQRPSRDYPPHLEDARTETYKRIGNTSLNVWIFESSSETDTSRPAIVFFFGGGWRSGTPAQFAPHARHFAKRGMVALLADYRVESRHGVKAADCVRDAISCVRWVRQNAERLRIDPNRIAAAGGSAGGHLAAATATLEGFDEASVEQTVSARPNAMLLFNPALVLAPLDGVELKGFGTNLDAERMGAEPRFLSPAHHLRRNLPPTIIFHGTADTTVPFFTAEAYAERARALGNRCELKAYAGQGHGFFNEGRPGDFYDQTLAEADRFLVSLGWIGPQ